LKYSAPPRTPPASDKEKQNKKEMQNTKGGEKSNLIEKKMRKTKNLYVSVTQYKRGEGRKGKKT